ncbi:AraC family transcriptional regulator [Aquipseudomonas alcaligenes]|uniref:Transcriptional regulator, AraC family n=1 Tax=Aquipseudomonas alcaligenes TaxID=43263 RepID=A0A1N6NP43_AQUAC|nr:AraC family transcriptional regulator [Pseudomonas alcaligenes]SIP93844.1 transcriptional regulator, AraC family [Pseudomonas alcaligenes]
MSKPRRVHTIYTESFFQQRLKLFEPFLQDAGLDHSVLARADCAIPLSRFVALWELLAGKVDPDIGVQVGAEPTWHSLGAFGHVVRSAPNIAAALACMSRYIVVHSQATRLDAYMTAEHVVIDYQLTDPTIIKRRQDAELSISLIATNLREITGCELYPVRVEFEHAAPSRITVHRDIFRCPVVFSSGSNRLYYSLDLLERPLLTADARLHEVLVAGIEEQRQARLAESDLISHLSQIIAARLPYGYVSLEQVARSEGMSARTLQRRLGEQQIEFSVLVEDVRRALALQYVTDSGHNLTEVALMLGYSEASSFSRAFRRWTELTPQQYRQKARCA